MSDGKKNGEPGIPPDVFRAISEQVGEQMRGLQREVAKQSPAFRRSQEEAQRHLAELQVVQAAVEHLSTAMAEHMDPLPTSNLAAMSLPVLSKLEVFSGAATAIAEATTGLFRSVDWGGIAATDKANLPANVREIDDLPAVADMTLNDGIPTWWVPRQSLIEDLIVIDVPDDRFTRLVNHRLDVVTDCLSALDHSDGMFVDAARQAVRCLEQGHAHAAQSHAANLVDSLLRHVTMGKWQSIAERDHPDWDEIPMDQWSRNLLLRPLAQAYVRWYPNSGTPIPYRFSRHVTAHAVGHHQAFSDDRALAAVMLATSLAVAHSNGVLGG